MLNAELQMLKNSIATEPPKGSELIWQDILTAMVSVMSSPLTSQAERILIEILRFDGKLLLAPSSELPHSMIPEDMLKSLALQTLGKWTGLTHFVEMRRVQATAVSPALASTARAVIERARRTKRLAKDWELVDQVNVNGAERSDGLPPTLVPEIMRCTIGRAQGMTFMTGQRIGVTQLEPDLETAA